MPLRHGATTQAKPARTPAPAAQVIAPRDVHREQLARLSTPAHAWPFVQRLDNVSCASTYEHDWPADLTEDAGCLRCGLPYQEWSL
jgi:hypothetical protein